MRGINSWINSPDIGWIHSHINKRYSILLTMTCIALAMSSQISAIPTQASQEEIELQKNQHKFKAYIPKNYAFFEAIEGDLNKDGKNDLVLIVKATDPKAWIEHEYRGRLDRNRRGIVVLFSQNGKYHKVVQNLSIFSSENEDGGVYFAPELWIEIKNNRLNIHYGHGRYGDWNYSFRHEGSDFRLIGYDRSENRGPLIEGDTSINFLIGKKRDRKNSNLDQEQNPKFKETWTKINYAPVHLSKIKNIDELSFD